MTDTVKVELVLAQGSVSLTMPKGDELQILDAHIRYLNEPSSIRGYRIVGTDGALQVDLGKVIAIKVAPLLSNMRY